MSPLNPIRVPFHGHPLRALRFAAQLLIIGHLFTEFGYTVETAQGPSMLPTFEVMGTWLLLSKTYRLGRGLSVGDVVAYDIPIFAHDVGVKRVLGMPGDYVMISTPDGGLSTEAKMIRVPPGHCWLIGDNLSASRDSRLYGPVPLGLVRGRVLAQWGSGFKWVGNGLRPAGAIKS